MLAFHQEQRGALSVCQTAHVHHHLLRQRLQVKVVGDVLDDLQEELALVGVSEFPLVVDVFAGVSGEADLGLDEDAEHVDGGRGQGAELSHLLEAAPPLLQGAARHRLVGPEHVLHLGPSEILTEVFLGIGPVVSGIEEAGIAEASVYRRGRGAAVRGQSGVTPRHGRGVWERLGGMTPRHGRGVWERLESVLRHPPVDESEISFT